MRKKTFVTIAVVTTMSLSLAACNRTSPSGSATSGAKSAKSATLVISTLNNPFFVSVADGAKAKAKTLEATLHSETTKPPPRYTESTLLSAMEGAGKLVDDDDHADRDRIRKLAQEPGDSTRRDE